MLQSLSLDTPSKSGLTSVPSSSARKRGPQDSGKGVRVMVCRFHGCTICTKERAPAFPLRAYPGPQPCGSS